MTTKIYNLCCTVLLLGIFTTAKAQFINTFAGTPGSPAGLAGDGGPAVSALLNQPRSMAFDDTGNVYIVDAYNNCIRKVNTAGVISTFSGLYSGGFGGDGGAASVASYDRPNYIAIDAANNIYVCDANNARIRKIDHATNIITTIVGDGTQGYLGDGGPATAAEINFPAGIALDATGNLYIADAGNNCVRKVNTTGIISTIAGTPGSFGYTGDGGPATAASVDAPFGIAVDNGGNIFISLYYDSRVCKISPAGIITSYAGIGGGGGMGFAGNGVPATSATFDSPWGLATDVAGNLYIADNQNFRVRKVNTAGIVTTVAGTGGFGFLGDGGPATAAQLKDPQAVCVAPDGAIYIADHSNFTVRKVNGLLTHAPAFAGGATQTLSVCKDAAARNIDTLLSVTDTDTGQMETWSTVLAPSHGTLVASYAVLSTGSSMMPSALTYTPAAGYTGSDNFKVRVYDGTASDTIAVNVTITDCSTGSGVTDPAGNGNALSIYPNPGFGVFTFNLTAPAKEAIHVIITNMLGIQVKEIDTQTNTPANIDLNVPAGIYLISAATSQQKWSTRLTIMQ